MNFYSTNRNAPIANLSQATLNGLAPDGGLYMPEKLGLLPESFFTNLPNLSHSEIAFQAGKAILGNSIPNYILEEICTDAFNFPVPVIEVEKNTFCLELFQGPSYAFKDFGARFMARIMAWFLQNENRELHVLVATSGDTGGAVALGFLGVPGIKVTILYPSGKVSPLQEKQLTTLGQNINALEVDGTFDDCQRMVKEAFNNHQLSEKHNLTSANSINICRIVPQSFYYMFAAKALASSGLPLVFSVPSGNFGNLFGGLVAWKLGLPVNRFVAATNENDVFTKYLHTGLFAPKPSVRTLSNAMDVGNPSNFARIQNLFATTETDIHSIVSGYSYSDSQTTNCILSTYEKTGYIIEPHAAVALLGLKQYSSEAKGDFSGIFLGTAHPAKFLEVMPTELVPKVDIPQPLQYAMKGLKNAIFIEPTYAALANYLNNQ